MIKRTRIESRTRIRMFRSLNIIMRIWIPTGDLKSPVNRLRYIVKNPINTRISHPTIIRKVSNPSPGTPVIAYS